MSNVFYCYRAAVFTRTHYAVALIAMVRDVYYYIQLCFLTTSSTKMQAFHGIGYCNGNADESSILPINWGLGYPWFQPAHVQLKFCEVTLPYADSVPQNTPEPSLVQGSKQCLLQHSNCNHWVTAIIDVLPALTITLCGFVLSDLIIWRRNHNSSWIKETERPKDWCALHWDRMCYNKSDVIM